MLERHVHIPHRLVCVTDDPAGIDPRVEIVPLWDKCRALGGCYNRLWVFSHEARDLFGDRFVCIDLGRGAGAGLHDAVHEVRGLRDQRLQPNPRRRKRSALQRRTFHDERRSAGIGLGAVRSADNASHCAGGPSCHRLGSGVDQASPRARRSALDECGWRLRGPAGRHDLPENARLVLFAGKRDPSRFPYPWIREHWR